MIPFLARILDLLTPSTCHVCGSRLPAGADVLCPVCDARLPRTGYWQHPYDNTMARMFYGRIPIERAAALFFHQPHSLTARVIYDMKYCNRPLTAVAMGRQLARECSVGGFFDGIDVIIPVPLTRRRQHGRGYNQSERLAQGISEVTGLPVVADAVRRTRFNGSQTSLDRRSRAANVEGAFSLRRADAVSGRHVLVVDDVVTSGATAIACAEAACAAGDVRISVLSLAVATGMPDNRSIKHF